MFSSMLMNDSGWTQTPHSRKMKELNKAIGGKAPQPHRWRSITGEMSPT
jgi:hypothetical protein